MKKLILSAMIGAFAISTAQAGVFGVARHVAGDGYHTGRYAVVGAAKAVKYVATGVVHGVKHAAGDAKTVAR